MSDELDRLLRDAPGRFPTPSEDVTQRVEEQVLRTPPRRPGARMSLLALTAAVLVGIVVGRFVLPPDEPAIGAPTAPAITIDVQPKVVPAGRSIALNGAIVVRQAGELVQLEENPCGRGWTYLGSAETDERGAWSTYSSGTPGGRTSYRAVWRGARSSAVTVAVRPFVLLSFAGRGTRTLRVVVPAALANLHGRRVTLQRLVAGRWRAVRTARLAEDETPFGRSYVARITHSLPRGSVVRAALPLAQARPCLLGAVSNSLTT